MREQPAQIQHVFVGPTELFIEILCPMPQHDEHTKGYRFHQFMADCKLRHANVREAAREIIARANARREVAYQQAAE